MAEAVMVLKGQCGRGAATRSDQTQLRASFSPALLLALLERQELLPAQVVGVSSSGTGAMQLRVRPIQRCAKMLWPHFRHFGIRCMALLHRCGAGHVARAEQGVAHAVKGARSCGKPTTGNARSLRPLRTCAIRTCGATRQPEARGQTTEPTGQQHPPRRCGAGADDQESLVCDEMKWQSRPCGTSR